jgi:hypothetical protein
VGSKKLVDDSFLALEESKRIQKLSEKVLKDPRVQAVLSKETNENTSLRIQVSAQEGVVAEIGSEKVKIYEPKEILEKGLLNQCKRKIHGDVDPISLGKSLEARFEQKSLRERAALLTEKEQAVAKRVSEAFSKAVTASNQEKLDAEKRKTFNKAKDCLTLCAEGGAICRNQMALDIKNPKVGDFFGLGIDRGKAIAWLGEFNSTLDVLGGLSMVWKASDGYRLGKNHDNFEKKSLSLASVFLGAGIGVSGVLGIDQATAKLTGNATMVNQLGVGLPIFGAVLTGVQAIQTAYQTSRVIQFRSSLNAILDQENVSEAKICHEALTWIRQQISLTELEASEIIEKAKLQGKDEDEALKKAIQRKWDQFELRTGRKDAWILKDLISDEFLEKVQNEDPESLKLGKEIVSVISKSNLTELGAYIFNAFLLLLAIAGLVVSFTVATPIVSSVLGLLSAGLSLVVSTQKLWSKKLPQLFGFKGKEGIFGETLWEARNAICDRFYSRRIDKVNLKTCTEESLASSAITSAWKEACLFTQSLPMDVMV